LDSKYLENGDRYEVGLPGYLYAGPTGFRLAPSDLILHGRGRSKFKVIRFDVKCAKNGNGYDVGPNSDYIDCLWASLWMTLKSYRLKSQSFDLKYLENGDRYEVGP